MANKRSKHKGVQIWVSPEDRRFINIEAVKADCSAAVIVKRMRKAYEGRITK